MNDGDWHSYCLMSLNCAVGIQLVLSRRENETNSRENFGLGLEQGGCVLHFEGVKIVHRHEVGS